MFTKLASLISGSSCCHSVRKLGKKFDLKPCVDRNWILEDELFDVLCSLKSDC